MKSAALFLVEITVLTSVIGCGDVCDGEDVLESASITVPSDLEDLQGIKCILGDLDFDGSGSLTEEFFDLSALADLEIIEGDFDVDAVQSLTTLSLPRLEWVGRRGLERDGERIRGGFFLSGNPALQALELPSLTDVGGCFSVHDNTALSFEVVGELFNRVRSHAFPGSCGSSSAEEEFNNFDPFATDFDGFSGGL